MLLGVRVHGPHILGASSPVNQRGLVQAADPWVPSPQGMYGLVLVEVRLRDPLQVSPFLLLLLLQGLAGDPCGH